jgi:hypothetical protein
MSRLDREVPTDPSDREETCWIRIDVTEEVVPS